MILRDYFKLIFSIWLSVSTLINAAEGERWSRQVSNSEWIPLAHPRSQIPQGSSPNNQQLPSPPLPSIQALNLPPSLRQEYQQQLHQLQKTQESIHKLLLLQQQIRSQQQLLQNQVYLPNVIGPDEEKQQFRQNSIPNVPQHSELNSEALLAPQIPSDVLPSIYPAREFKPSNHEVAEGPSTSAESDDEKSGNGSNEEIQVVYVPAETLAQRGQPKEERNRDHKQFSFQRQQNEHYQQLLPPRQHQHQHQQHQQQPHQQQHHQQHQYHQLQHQHPQNQLHQQHQHHPQHEQVEHAGGSMTFPDDGSSYNSELIQFPRGQAESDQFFKEARQKELDRLNEERKEIQKQAKVQAAARLREQERMRQREAENKMKELVKIEELARQRELDRIREERERHHLDELKREKERTAKLKEELARREIERLAAVERQKKIEAERSRARQKELEKFARQEEEAKAKEVAAKKEAVEAPAAEQLINQQHQQHHTEIIKHQKRTRNKPRQRPHHHHHKQAVDQLNNNNEVQTTTPTPNQPPLAVFMGSDLEAEEVKIVDVLRVLRDIKTIAVLDQVMPETPKVFVGPSNLEAPRGYAKFDLPYLSALDTNRVERRVDKLPFFVAPLSFNPPQGYSKIPFPAPHIGSVIINNLEGNTGPSAGGSETIHKPSPNPLIEPNSFIATSGQGATYQASFESPTVTPYSPYTQDHVTSQYQSSVYPSTPDNNFRYRQQQQHQQVQGPQLYELPTGSNNFRQPQSESISTYEEQVTALPKLHHNPQYSEQPFLGQVTSDDYRRPNVVSSFSYNQEQVSTTPAYHDSYAHTRVQPNKDQQLVSELAQLNQHDYSQHRHGDDIYQHSSQQVNPDGYHQQQYHLSSNVPNLYEETSIRNPIGPPQYNLPAELPPIHPQLPGLVNSLSEGKESDKIITTTTTTTPAPTTTITTTTEIPTTTYRVRMRQRGRITRPTTTSTTTSSPSTHRSNPERTRRPFNRSRSRYTTTTEEYRETLYEAEKDKVPITTPKYNNSPEQYRRPISSKTFKLKTRGGGSDRTTYEPITTLNQIPNIQTHETLSDEASPSDELGDLPQTTYAQYNIPTESMLNAYLHQGNGENPANVYSTEIDYLKSQNYPRGHGSSRHEKPAVNDVAISQPQQQQEYDDRFPAQGTGYQASLDRQPINGYEYDIRDGGSTPVTSPMPNDYSYYQDKNGNVELMSNTEQVQTETPIYRQILEFAATPQSNVQHSHSSDGDYKVSGGFDNGNRGSTDKGQSYTQYTPKELIEYQTEMTTEPIQTTTTTTTTEPAPVIYRQRVRARIGGRPRQESTLQTQSRGPQDEYVRFSAVNQASNGSRQQSSPSGSRSRDSARLRLKTRPNYHNQAQVQSEGNEYVRIQSSNRATTYPKTIVQTARGTTTTTTTTTTSTTPVPLLTTTEESSFGDDDNEYGFIRTPNFNQPHHQLSSKFRAPESQLQNIAPTDETAEDSSPTHTQIPKHRQKYHSANRPRPIIKSSTTSITTTQSSLDNSPYTTKSRVRADEPKNRIRVKGRRPGRRRTTTTTSTTTEYTLEGNNNLPLDENYPRISISSAERNVDRQQPLYEQNYGNLQNSGVDAGSSRAEYVEENYPTQDFALNFGSNIESEEHQSHLAHKHQATSDYHPGSASTSRLRPYSSHAASSERDIYGSESQWSTKLTKSSFQPVNQFNQEEGKIYGNQHASQEIKDDIPEIITAQPEDDFMTVLVTSDDAENQTKSESPTSASESLMEFMGFGQNMNHSDTTQSSIRQVEVDSTSEVPQPRKVGHRRRRIRVRVRPAPPDDFVTAESQYINSAVNSLTQDRSKSNIQVDSSSEIHSKSMIDNSAVKQERLVPLDSTELPNPDELISSTTTTTINSTELPDHGKELHSSTSSPTYNDESTEINKSHENMSTTMEALTTNFEKIINDVTITPPLMTTMTIPRKSWDSTKAYSNWIMKKMEKSLTPGDNQVIDKSEIDEDSNEQGSDDKSENYPKNHRSEWSEVRYPSDRGVYGYDRSEMLSPTTQLPGIVTKSIGDTSVKTLSDYVQAIFDSMKNADEERSIVDNAPNLWSDDQTKSTTSTEVNDINRNVSTDGALETNSSTPILLVDNEKKVERKDENAMQSSEKGIISSTTDIIQTSSENPTTRSNTEISDLATSASSITTLSEPSITTVETAVNPIENGTSKLGSVIRTSTTTKVSHMTEICYRGRCIMTKPKKDFHER